MLGQLFNILYNIVDRNILRESAIRVLLMMWMQFPGLPCCSMRKRSFWGNSQVLGQMIQDAVGGGYCFHQHERALSIFLFRYRIGRR